MQTALNIRVVGALLATFALPAAMATEGVADGWACRLVTGEASFDCIALVDVVLEGAPGLALPADNLDFEGVAHAGDCPATFRELDLTGTDFDLADYKGDQICYYTPDCGAGLSYDFDTLPPGWNDRVSSASGGGNGCDTFWHYEHIDQGGAQLACQPDCATMGVMDNHTSSVRFVD